jgi:Methylamine utilisation protein MauE
MNPTSIDAAALWLIFAQVSLSTTFLASAIQKLRTMQLFAAGLEVFGVARNLRRVATQLLVTSELIVAAMLLTSGISLMLALTLCATMLIGFSIVLIRLLAAGARANCNCFGASRTPISGVEVFRNIGLLIVVAMGWLSAMSFPGNAPSALDSTWSAIRAGHTTTMALATAGVALALVWSRLPQIVALAKVQ